MEQSLLPQNNRSLIEVSESNETMPSKAFYIDFENKKVVGMIDHKKAMEQSILLALQTSRYNHLIFSWNYGEELKNLIGKPKDLAKVEIPRLIKECLLVDDRITAIEDINIEEIKEGLKVIFTAITIHGEIPIENEVSL